ASVPNVAHGTIRLALLGGRFPYSETGPTDTVPMSFFTRDSAEELLSEAGFLVGDIERLTSPITPPVVSPGEPDLPADLVAEVGNDPDALASEFIFVAYPVEQIRLELVHRRLRELSERRDAAQREVGQLRQQLAEQQQVMDALQDRAQRATARETQL